MEAAASHGDQGSPLDVLDGAEKSIVAGLVAGPVDVMFDSGLKAVGEFPDQIGLATGVMESGGSSGGGNAHKA